MPSSLRSPRSCGEDDDASGVLGAPAPAEDVAASQLSYQWHGCFDHAGTGAAVADAEFFQDRRRAASLFEMATASISQLFTNSARYSLVELPVVPCSTLPQDQWRQRLSALALGILLHQLRKVVHQRIHAANF